MRDIKKTNIAVYVTEDTLMFKKLLGNRDVTNARVSQIINSIQTVGYITNPIIVNEKLEIIDGQGRCEACRRLNLPVYYIIAEGAGLDECIAMNILRKNWQMEDYVNSYSTKGMFDYKILENAAQKFKHLNLRIIAGVLAGRSSSGHGFDYIIQSGEFKVAEIKQAEIILGFLSNITHCVSNSEMSNQITLNTLAGLAREDLIDMDRMESQLKKYYGIATCANKVENVLEQLQMIYNRNMRTKVYFRDFYILKNANRNKQ